MVPAATRNSQPTPVLAFFDVDNTLVRGASMYHIARVAWRERLITVADILRFGWHQARFVAVGENHGHMNHIRQRAMQLVGGHRKSDLIALAESTFSSHIRPNIWPETLEVAHEHLRQGHEVWLITATPQIMAQVIADELGFTGALGTVIETIDGVFTGELVGPMLHGVHKATEASRLAADRGAVLADCWAYSDSRNDIPLLSIVGHRVAVNPDSALAAHAAKLGWPVLILKPASIRAARKLASGER
jgi:HAD superfamily hydrolase (TIGR01490 family)